MPSTVRIKIIIGKGDEDIKDWLDKIESLGQSRAIWISALLYAFRKDLKLDTGDYEMKLSYVDRPYAARKESYPMAKEKTHEKSYGTNISNTEIIKIYNELLDENYIISRVIKEMIRRGFCKGDPDLNNAKRVLVGEPGVLKRRGRIPNRSNRPALPNEMPQKDDEENITPQQEAYEKTAKPEPPNQTITDITQQTEEQTPPLKETQRTFARKNPLLDFI